MSPANLDGIKQGEKRSRAIAHADELDEAQVVEPSSPNAHQPAGKRPRIFVLPSWSDIPRWWPSDKSPLMEMPLEIWDKIFSVESGLALQDHMAMAGTCKQIRRAYTEDVWKVLDSLWYNRCALANHIFSAANLTPVDETTDLFSIGTCRQQIADAVNSQTINLTSARTTYKVTEKEIMTLPYEIRRNPHGRNMAPMKLFRSARVRALALRVHGGPFGHAAHLKKLAEKDAKSKATRRMNGTVQVRKPRISDPSYHSLGFPPLVMAIADDDYDGYGYDG